jgi:hypothetical protein
MLTVDEQEKFLGNLKFGVPHNFKYIITNSGDKTIVVTKLVLGCNSCTKASVVKQVIGVGETSQVDVTYTPGATGISTKQLIVQYTNGVNPDHLLLKFKAHITK